MVVWASLVWGAPKARGFAGSRGLRMRAVLLCAGLLLSTSMVQAEQPACFVGRTLFGPLRGVADRQGRYFAVLGLGSVVRVVADRVGTEGGLAEVKAVGPYRVQGFVDRTALRVFTRREVPIVPGWSWLRKGALVKILRHQDGRAQVEYEGVQGDGGEVRQGTRIRATWAACADLKPREIDGAFHPGGDCCVAPSAPSTPALHTASLTHDVLIRSDDGSRHAKLNRDLTVAVIAREGTRALIDASPELEPIRLRGYIDAAALDPDGPADGFGVASLCRDADYRLPVGDEEVSLLGTSPLWSASRGGEPIASLPKGTRVRWVDKRDGAYRVVLREPNSHKFALWLAGWVPESALPPRTRDQVTVHLDGQLVPRRGEKVPKLAGFQITALGTGTDPVVSDEAGRFRIELRDRATLDGVRAESPDGRTTGQSPPITVERGGTPMRLAVGPDARLRVTLATQAGVRIPDAELYAIRFGGEFQPMRWRTDAQGVVEKWLPAGRYDVGALPGENAHAGTPIQLSPLEEDASNGMQRSDPGRPGTLLTSDTALELVVGRTPVWLGAVERLSSGRCATDHVLVESSEIKHRMLPVHASTCSFALEFGPRVLSTFDAVPVTLRTPDGMHRLERELTIVGDEPAPACLGRSCPKSSSLFVTVANAGNVAVLHATVEAFADSSPGAPALSSCVATDGMCYLHGLPTGRSLELRVRAQDGRRGRRAVARTQPGVQELVVQLENRWPKRSSGAR